MTQHLTPSVCERVLSAMNATAAALGAAVGVRARDVVAAWAWP